jgi:hypothetical protein
VLAGVASIVAPYGREWLPPAPTLADPGKGSQLDRPPKSIVAA